MDFGEGKDIRARVRHRCEWCFEPILPDRVCYHYHGKFQDEWQNWYMHPECRDAMMKDPDVMEDGFMPGENERPRSSVPDATGNDHEVTV